MEPNQARCSVIGDDEDTEELDPPKALGDVVEALAGAVFLDSGMDLSAVWNVFQPFFEPLIGMFECVVLECMMFRLYSTTCSEIQQKTTITSSERIVRERNGDKH